jgi:hypothetical protein
MNFLLLFFISVCGFQSVHAAQQKVHDKIEFDYSVLHPHEREELDDYIVPITEEIYQQLCRDSLVSFLRDAVDARDCPKIRELIEQGADLNACVDTWNSLRGGQKNKVLLHIAAVRGYADVVEELLKAPSSKIDSIGTFIKMDRDNRVEHDGNSIQMTPLLLALSCGDVIGAREEGTIEEYEKIVELLINHKACCRSVQDDTGSCDDALLSAIEHGTPRMVKLLIAADALVDEKSLIAVFNAHLDDVIPEEAWLAIVEELLFQGAAVDVPVGGETFMQLVVPYEEDSSDSDSSDGEVDELGEKIQHIFENVKKRKQEFAQNVRKTLIDNGYLIADLAFLVNEYMYAKDAPKISDTNQQ